MNLLMSAYACEPNKGSEPEVGWRWMIDSAKIYDNIVVVTRANNRKNIEKEFYKLNIKNVQFIYFDLPKWASFWKKAGRGVQLYTYLWEIFLFFFLLKKYKRNQFDVSQRVTFVSYRFPSFIWYFSKKFILGPVAGGERYPLDFLKIFSFKGKMKELVRMIIQRISLLDPLILLTLYKAETIIAVTNDTKTILPFFAQKKVIIKPAIFININDFKVNINQKIFIKEKQLKLLYVGRIIEWKGIELILKALKDLDIAMYDFNIIGEGNAKSKFTQYISKYNLNVNFLGQKNRKELSDYYLTHDLFLFPSLHDSGGMVILEAKAHGLPVVVSSFGGPQQFTDEKDYVVKAKNVNDFISELSNIIKSQLS